MYTYIYKSHRKGMVVERARAALNKKHVSRFSLCLSRFVKKHERICRRLNTVSFFFKYYIRSTKETMFNAQSDQIVKKSTFSKATRSGHQITKHIFALMDV